MVISQTQIPLCIFCYKPAPTINKNGDQGDNCNGRNFFQMFTRHIHLEQQPPFKLRFCNDCAHLGNSFCSSFSKLELARLEIKSKVERFFEIMSCADKVSSRVANLEEQFKYEADLKSFNQLRRNLIKYCT